MTSFYELLWEVTSYYELIQIITNEGNIYHSLIIHESEDCGMHF